MSACVYPSAVTSPFLCPFWDLPEFRVDTILNCLAKRKNKFWMELAYITARMRLSIRSTTCRNVLPVLGISEVKPQIVSVELRYFLSDRHFLRDLWAALVTVGLTCGVGRTYICPCRFFWRKRFVPFWDIIIFLHHDVPYFGVKSSELFISSAA